MKARRQQCKARISDGSRQCERWAMKGQEVCGHHGGRSPQAKRSAKERLAELVEPALEGLQTALKSGEIPSIVRAAQVVLDRTGFHPTKAVEVSGKDGGPIETQSSQIDVDSLSYPLRLLLLYEVKGNRLTAEQEQTLLEMLGPAERFLTA